MADILLEKQGIPTAPAAGQSLIWVDTYGYVCAFDDSALMQARGENFSVADQVLGTGDTYVTGSSIRIPSFGVRVGTMLRWILGVTKTAGGTATPVYQLRVGANQTTADTSRASVTGLAQTAVVDTAIIMVFWIVRSVSATGATHISVKLSHELAVTGFANNNSSIDHVTPATFDNSSLGGLFAGLSINAGAASAWTVHQCRVEAKW